MEAMHSHFRNATKKNDTNKKNTANYIDLKKKIHIKLHQKNKTGLQKKQQFFTCFSYFLRQRVTLIKDHLCTLKLLKSTKSSFFEPRNETTSVTGEELR